MGQATIGVPCWTCNCSCTIQMRVEADLHHGLCVLLPVTRATPLFLAALVMQHGQVPQPQHLVVRRAGQAVPVPCMVRYTSCPSPQLHARLGIPKITHETLTCRPEGLR